MVHLLLLEPLLRSPGLLWPHLIQPALIGERSPKILILKTLLGSILPCLFQEVFEGADVFQLVSQLATPLVKVDLHLLIQIINHLLSLLSYDHLLILARV